MSNEKLVAEIVEASGGELTGRIRLQKIVYLLQEIDSSSRFGYDYHYYGPYSPALATATEETKDQGLIEEEFGYRKSDGARFSVFKIEDAQSATMLSPELRKKAKSLSKERATILELAATVHWLKFHEEVDDWKSEITRRKGRKAEGGRLEEALRVLKEIGLAPDMVTA
jgi:uncharacterized protein YwgA